MQIFPLNILIEDRRGMEDLAHNSRLVPREVVDLAHNRRGVGPACLSMDGGEGGLGPELAGVS